MGVRGVLSPVEQAYLSGTREFTKVQQRYIRCRLRKKLRLLDAKGCNAAAMLQRLEGVGASSVVRILRRDSVYESERKENGPVGIRTQDLRFRRPPQLISGVDQISPTIEDLLSNFQLDTSSTYYLLQSIGNHNNN
jgi:hypothetical protein